MQKAECCRRVQVSPFPLSSFQTRMKYIYIYSNVAFNTLQVIRGKDEEHAVIMTTGSVRGGNVFFKFLRKKKKKIQSMLINPVLHPKAYSTLPQKSQYSKKAIHAAVEKIEWQKAISVQLKLSY